MEPTFAQVQALCAGVLGCDPALIRPTARLEEDLGADSFGRAELASSLETLYGAEVPDEVFFKLTTLGQLLASLGDGRFEAAAP